MQGLLQGLPLAANDRIAYIRAAQGWAQVALDRGWAAVEAIAAVLQRQNVITGAEAIELVDAAAV
jgi:hypothetical protein